jgi:hypothetical protein
MTKGGNIYCGIGGWTYEPWRGVFYPKAETISSRGGFVARGAFAAPGGANSEVTGSGSCLHRYSLDVVVSPGGVSVAEPSFTDILQDRTHRYRRSLIVVCLILIAVYSVPIRFDELSLFGVKPVEGYHHTHDIVIAVLWLVWLYHAMLVGYYTQRDWKDWRSNLRSGDSNRRVFPEIRMYFPRLVWGYPSRQLGQSRELVAGIIRKTVRQHRGLGFSKAK